MTFLSKHLPSPAMMVALLALFVALGGAAYAGVAANSVGTKHLKRGAVKAPKIAKGAVKTPKLAKRAVKTPKIAAGAVKSGKIANGQVRTPDLATGAVAAGNLANAAVTTPKLAGDSVNSAKVVNDSLTGNDIDESSLGQVPVATSADTATSAGDADTLGGLAASSLIRAAGDASNDLPEANGAVLTAEITAPREGFLHIVGSVDLRHSSTGDDLSCHLLVDGGFVAGSVRGIHLDGDRTDSGGDTLAAVNTGQDCATNGLHAVTAGAHTVDLHMLGLDAGTFLNDGALNVLFVPFDGSGS